MKKFLLTLPASLCAYLFVVAQNTSTCNADFTYSIDGYSVKFFAAQSSENQQHYWSFGDGSAAEGQVQLFHNYSNSGTYRVLHRVKDELQNCWDSVSKEITIHESNCNIEPKFDWKPNAANCLQIEFLNKSIPISPNVRFYWKFGDGGVSHETNPTHTYNQPGEYEVCLIIEAGDYCSREYCFKIKVTCDRPCDAGFTFSIDGYSVKFSSTQSSANQHHYWSFGDGKDAEDLGQLVHTYLNAGTYRVLHRVKDELQNCWDSVSKEITIHESNCNIEPKFDWKPNAANCLQIEFLNQSIPISPNVHFYWKFGDGGVSHETNPTHTYDQLGEYEVCLIIEAGDYCRREYCFKIKVTCDEPCNVDAYFKWKKDETKWNKIHFANLSGPVPDIWKTSWSYGDGTASNDFNTFHTYEKPGLYFVCLKIQSLNGCISEFCDTVVVRDPQRECETQSRFRYRRSLYNDQEFKFEPEFRYPNRKYYWSFGDGTTSTEMSPVHKFREPGAYNVCLTVVLYNTNTTEPCRSRTCKEIRVGFECRESTLRFEYKSYPDKPWTISFYAIGNQAIKKQKWIISRDTANGVTNPWFIILEEADPTYTFREKGWYRVCLKATFENGCEISYCERIFVERTERATFNSGNDIVVYPNPATNSANFQLRLEMAQPVVVWIYDNLGVLKIEKQFAGHAGNNYITIPVEQLYKGTYYALIRFGNHSIRAKFQKG
jgi:PKD repeat protein